MKNNSKPHGCNFCATDTCNLKMQCMHLVDIESCMDQLIAQFLFSKEHAYLSHEIADWPHNITTTQASSSHSSSFRLPNLFLSSLSGEEKRKGVIAKIRSDKS